MLRLVSAILIATVVLLGGPTAAAGPAQGNLAPDFELSDQDGNVHSIGDYRDQWVALYFYPKDDTPGCTTEACEFRDDIFKFRRMGCAILGVSLDDAASHKAFAEKHGLPFPLLADTEGRTADAYGVMSNRSGVAMASRQTFLIDPRGNIVKHYANVDPESHSRQLLQDLQELQELQTRVSE